MSGGQDVDLYDEPLPHWASGLAHGDYLAVGAVLPTRDGRNSGNSTLIRWDPPMETGGTPFAVVRTDAGNDMHLTEREIMEWFWPPVWIRKPEVGLLEPGVASELCEVHKPSPMLLAETSAAISLKRIADALEGNGNDRAGLTDTLSNAIYGAITTALSGSCR